QEDSSNTNKFGGSGLGMAITKNMVEMMNGTISVESEKGKGSTFTVEIGLRESEHASADKSEHLTAIPENMKILVVDDDPIACQHAKIVLEEAGFTSETCMTKDEALELVNLYHARREDFNLMLIDLKMPEDDGIQVTKAIREVIGNDAAIIILTAYTWDDVEEDARNAGVDGFMHKPLYTQNILKEFKAALRRRQDTTEKVQREINIQDKRILLAEDVEINAKIMQRLLKMKGAVCEIAENGKLAFELFEEKGDGYFDAILMDIRMPEWDGLQSAEAIRGSSLGYAKSIPIIAMTANAFDEDVQKSLKVGMNAHLSKPVEPEKLYETLDNLINKDS
ncbi:MAG: response regulator, partial [Pseudobutyrivibrio sp.]|nr:response regulator [Pseudobutyrivibrio sp.]